MWWWAVDNARADENAALYRINEPVSSRRYTRVDGQPAIARWRNQKGPFEAWTFADGQVEHYRRYDGRKLIEEAWFDADGDRFASIDVAANTVLVHGRTDVSVPIGSWPAQAWGSIVIHAPWVTSDADHLEATFDDGLRFRLAWASAEDVTSDAFRDGLQSRCACELVDRAAGFTPLGRGVRYLVLRPEVGQPRLGEVWAVPVGDRVLLAAYDAPTTSDPVGVDDPAVRLARGRALMARLELR